MSVGFAAIDWPESRTKPHWSNSLTILRNQPKVATVRTICAELEKAGIDLSCYKKPVSAIGAVLKQIPGVKVIRKRRSDWGTVRAYYEIEG